MILAAAFIVALATQPPAMPMSEKDRVRHVLVQKHGSKTQIYSILVKGSYAVAQGPGFHDGLHKSGGEWKIVCSDLPSGRVEAQALQTHCGFPQDVALVASVEEPINVQAAQGQFESAAAAQKKVFASATGPERDLDRARYQQLTLLSEQMRTATITREQAIQQWGQVRFSWFLPW